MLQKSVREFQEQPEIYWRKTWELALKGDNEAISKIKSHINGRLDKQHPFTNCNLTRLLTSSKFHLIAKEEIFGNYQLYSNVPSFLLLSGHIQMQCINIEGDNQTIMTLEHSGFLQLTEPELKSKFGENNITLITKFQIIGVKPSVLIELDPSSLESLIPQEESKISLREEMIMKKYMIIALKHITKLTYSKQTPLTQKFYLLEGRACYFHSKSKTILCCYQQGIFDPSFAVKSEFALHVFQGAYLMILEGEMMKDEVVTGVELKRNQHLTSLLKKYEKMSMEEKVRVQQKLIEKYKLNKKQVDAQIRGIVNTVKPVEKVSKAKNDLTQTSSSIKEKCSIRIRKSKKMT